MICQAAIWVLTHGIAGTVGQHLPRQFVNQVSLEVEFPRCLIGFDL